MKSCRLYIFVTFILAFITSCSSSQDKTFSRVNVDQYYRETGVLKYFLPTQPSWANVSQIYGCKRSGVVQFLNLKNISSSFGLTYLESLQLQYTYNYELAKAEELAGKKASPTAEEKLFFKAFDSIKAGNFIFKTPSFKRVNFILVDSFQTDMKSLRELMGSASMYEGRPVFFSQCLKRSELIKLLKENSIPLGGARILSLEILSPYDLELNLTGIEEINLSGVFQKDQKIHIYYQRKKPENIKGKFILKKQ